MHLLSAILLASMAPSAMSSEDDIGLMIDPPDRTGPPPTLHQRWQMCFLRTRTSATKKRSKNKRLMKHHFPMSVDVVMPRRLQKGRTCLISPIFRSRRTAQCTGGPKQDYELPDLSAFSNGEKAKKE